MKYSFIRFLLVGAINTLVGLTLIYVLFYGFHYTYWVSTIVGNSMGAVVSYFLNRNFTFKSSNSYLASITRFILVIGICYIISYSAGLKLASWILDTVFEQSNIFSKDIGILIGASIYTILNYIGQRKFVFPVSNSERLMEEQQR